MDTLTIAQKIKSVPVEKIFGYEELKEINWLWINRDIFRDIIYSADTKDELEESEIDEFLRIIGDEDFVELLQDRMSDKGFVFMDSIRFKKLEKGFKDFGVKTFIFVNRRYLARLLVHFNDEFDWILKAMTVDLSGYNDRELQEVYKEYFENNARILEEIAVNGSYSQDLLEWDFDMDTNTLSCSYQGEKTSQWSGEEAITRFEELMER
ncbi:hypothetical protein [Alkalibacter saccharofermentans]|uniref:Uncharacterized protein n=1 Tax=Alkalibacter saccharofermentans DSM 14828 TaxID=1120975 RepID=A0A1M4XES9_9FIRM|nr:hypothetical protein [Alkalibacter saccharofermentans]SHE91941.1 hypothetical protein SAMN02746064_01495 [Alkalibacter saccharofermentans DSM 14828]